MKRYWYFYIPVRWAGSSGNTLLAKSAATEREVLDAFSHCARINTATGTVEIYKRP